MLGPYIKSIDKWLTHDKDSPKKQRHTGTRIYNRLKHEQNYLGSLSTVLHYVQVARQRIGIRLQAGLYTIRSFDRARKLRWTGVGAKQYLME